MNFGVSLPNFGSYADPSMMVQLASTAEESGWNGFFVWDHIVVANDMPVADPWVLCAAIAQVTNEIRLGPMVTPLPRRRPWVVARQASTLDHLSKGRLILGVGIGFPPDVEFGTFGEPTQDRHRADMLDEALSVLAGMWSGRPFEFSGEYYAVARTTFGPTPFRTSGIPIWVGAGWPNRRPIERAARFQAVYPVKMDMTEWTIEEVANLALTVGRLATAEGFDIVVGGALGADRASPAEYEEAGATWLVDGPPMGSSVDDVWAMIAAGPQ